MFRICIPAAVVVLAACTAEPVQPIASLPPGCESVNVLSPGAPRVVGWVCRGAPLDALAMLDGSL